MSFHLESRTLYAAGINLENLKAYASSPCDYTYDDARSTVVYGLVIGWTHEVDALGIITQAPHIRKEAHGEDVIYGGSAYLGNYSHVAVSDDRHELFRHIHEKTQDLFDKMTTRSIQAELEAAGIKVDAS